jgi:two-component system sensor histidine kinase YesM
MWRYVVYPFRRLGILNKLILFYIFFIFAPGVIAMVVYYQKSVQVNEQEMNESILRTLHQAAVNISYHKDNVSRASDLFFSKPRLHEYLRRYENYEAYEHLQDFVDLIEYITNVSDYPDVHRIRVFIDPQLPFSKENIHFFPMTILQRHDWFNTMAAKNGDVLWKSAYKQLLSDELTTDVLSAVRIIRNPQQFDEIIGVLIIDMKEETLFASIGSINFDMSSDTYVVNENGVIIAHADKSHLGDNRSDYWTGNQLATEKEGYFKKDIGNETNYVLFSRIPESEWTIVSEIPVSMLSSRSRQLTRTSGIIVMAATFIVFLLVIVLSFGLLAESLSRRIKDLIRIMRRDGIGRFNDRLRFGFRDFRLLEQNILELVDTTNSMAEENYRARLREREAQLRALQAQINPHFLYNTLETINWMAIRHSASDISSLIKSLTTYFRLTLNKGRDFISVHDEVRLSRAYLDIQKARFENWFETVFEMDPGAESVLIPKLTLQPIIENALLHGIRRRRGETLGWIRVSITREHDDLILTVADNGPGIPPDSRTRLMPVPRPAAEEASGGYGLYNVHERIRLYCGDAYGVVVRSEEGCGTEVIIRMKVMKKE